MKPGLLCSLVTNRVTGISLSDPFCFVCFSCYAYVDPVARICRGIKRRAVKRMKQKSRHDEIKLIHTLNILHSHAGREEFMYRSARK